MSTRYQLDRLEACVVAFLVYRSHHWDGGQLDGYDDVYDIIDLADHAGLMGPQPRGLGLRQMDRSVLEQDITRLIKLYTSNDSPCWRCHEGGGDHVSVMWDDESSQYLHETHDAVTRDDLDQ